MEQLKFEGISENMSYLFTNKGVTKISSELNDLNGRNYVPYTYENLNVAIDILKENVFFKYKIGKINLQEYCSQPRKFLNTLIEIYQPKNQITLIKEWEESFGSKLFLINESTDNLIIESRINESWEFFKHLLEQWYNPADWGRMAVKGVKNIYDYGKEKGTQAVNWGKEQASQIKDKGVLQYTKDKAASVWQSVKNGITKAWNCITANPVECIMEGMRTLVFSAPGVAILTGAEFIPVVGQVSNSIIFGSLLIWDTYKALSGKYEEGQYKWSIWEIIFDMASLFLPIAGKILKSSLVGVKSFAQFGKMAVKEGGLLYKIFNVIKSGLGTILSAITNSAKFIGDKLGIKWLSNFGGKASSKIENWVSEMSAGAAGTAPKVSKSLKSLSTAERAEYDKLEIAWKKQQESLGKGNLKPGQTTREKLINQAKQNVSSPKQQLKNIWSKSPKAPIPPKGVIVKRMGSSFLVTTALCAALGLDSVTCQNKIENGEVNDEEIKKAQEKIQQDLEKGIEDAGGFDDLEFEL